MFCISLGGLYILVIQCIIGDIVTVVKSVAKKWGNSMGILIPMDVVKKEKIKDGQDVEIIIMKSDNTLRKLFGLMKNEWKEPTQKIKDDIKKELYDD